MNNILHTNIDLLAYLFHTGPGKIYIPVYLLICFTLSLLGLSKCYSNISYYASNNILEKKVIKIISNFFSYISEKFFIFIESYYTKIISLIPSKSKISKYFRNLLSMLIFCYIFYFLRTFFFFEVLGIGNVNIFIILISSKVLIVSLFIIIVEIIIIKVLEKGIYEVLKQIIWKIILWFIIILIFNLCPPDLVLVKCKLFFGIDGSFHLIEGELYCETYQYPDFSTKLYDYVGSSSYISSELDLQYPIVYINGSSIGGSSQGGNPSGFNGGSGPEGGGPNNPDPSTAGAIVSSSNQEDNSGGNLTNQGVMHPMPVLPGVNPPHTPISPLETVNPSNNTVDYDTSLKRRFTTFFRPITRTNHIVELPSRQLQQSQVITYRHLQGCQNPDLPTYKLFNKDIICWRFLSGSDTTIKPIHTILDYLNYNRPKLLENDGRTEGSNIQPGLYNNLIFISDNYIVRWGASFKSHHLYKIFHTNPLNSLLPMELDGFNFLDLPEKLRVPGQHYLIVDGPSGVFCQYYVMDTKSKDIERVLGGITDTTTGENVKPTKRNIACWLVTGIIIDTDRSMLKIPNGDLNVSQLILANGGYPRILGHVMHLQNQVGNTRGAITL